MDKINYEGFAPEVNYSQKQRIDPSSLSSDEFLIVNETIRAYNASHAIVHQDVSPLWKAANRSLVISTCAGVAMYQAAKRFAATKPNLPLVAAGISWIVSYRVANFFFRKDVMDNLLNGDTQLSASLREALERHEPQQPPQLTQTRQVTARRFPAPLPSSSPQFTAQESSSDEGGQEGSSAGALPQRPRVSLLQGMKSPVVDENGQRRFVTWDDIRSANTDQQSGSFSDK